MFKLFFYNLSPLKRLVCKCACDVSQINSVWPPLQRKREHQDFQYAVVRYFAEKNTSACLCAVNCCLRLKSAITFYFYVISPVWILSVDFGVYQYEPSGSKARTSLNNVMSQRNSLYCLWKPAFAQYFIFPDNLFNIMPLCSFLPNNWCSRNRIRWCKLMYY